MLSQKNTPNDFTWVPYLTQRDFQDPNLRWDKSYKDALNEEGHPWDTCQISARSMKLLETAAQFPGTKLDEYHLKTIEEVYFQQITNWLLTEKIQKGVKKVSRFRYEFHMEMMNQNFKANNIPFTWVAEKATPANIISVLNGKKPKVFPQSVIIGTEISQFLKNVPKPYSKGGAYKGHIQLFVKRTDTGFISKDPYGNAASGYSDKNGDNVFYNDGMCKYLISNISMINYLKEV